MKTAVIKTGSKQYLVTEGDTLKIEKIETEAGKEFTFDEVLLTVDGEDTVIGAPLIKGASVKAKVLEHGKHDKVVGVKMKAKKRNKKYFGHRQQYTQVEIVGISLK